MHLYSSSHFTGNFNISLTLSHKVGHSAEYTSLRSTLPICHTYTVPLLYHILPHIRWCQQKMLLSHCRTKGMIHKESF